MEEIAKKLVPLGLTEKEAQVYIALLQLGRASAYSVATKSGLKKSTTYVILGQLIEKGLAIEVPREKKQLFAPRSPEDFVTKAEQQLQSVKRLLPELSSLYRNLDISKARTMYFEGISGMRQALWYKEKELRGKEIVGFFASAKTASPETILLFDEWNEDAVKNNTGMRGFSVVADEDDKFIRKLIQKYKGSPLKNIKFLPSEFYKADVSIDAGEDFVRIDLIGAEQIVIVESIEFAKMFRQIFEMCWKYLPTVEGPVL